MVAKYSEFKISNEELQKRWRQQFELEYPTDLDCLLAIYRCGRIDTSRCSRCTSNDVEPLNGYRELRCRSCGFRGWLTAGTFFAKMKKPRLWWGAIWLKQQGIVVNANQLSRLARCSYDPAWTICKKLEIVILSKMPAELQTGSHQFLPLMCRRSRLTPAGDGPDSEEWETSDDCSRQSETAEISPNQNTVTISELDAEQKAVYEQISESPITVDVLAAKAAMPVSAALASLTLLEIDGLVQMVPGGAYVRPRFDKQKLSNGEGDASPETMSAIQQIIRFVREIFNGISRKYLQAYIANCWFHLDASEQISQNLIEVCAQFRRIKRHEIREFVTAKTVLLFRL